MVRTLTEAAADAVLDIANSPDEGPLSNIAQPVLLVCLREITPEEEKALVKIGLRVLKLQHVNKNIDLIGSKNSFDLICIDAFDPDVFQLLRQNYKQWQEHFNLTLYQRNGYLSDQDFKQYFENIIKKLPLDAHDVQEFKKGMNQQPYMSRPLKPWRVFLKKLLRLVFKL